jgi:DNA (cytosine-5)-methyltransferase 1
MELLTYGSLFSGIGGFDLGLERAKWEPAFQVEIDPKCNEILKRYWSRVPQFTDVQEVGKDVLPGPIDLLVGGFPCQDLSLAGSRQGLDGQRSGLFFEFMRIAAELTPRWLLIENVPGLLSSNGGRDMGTILGHMGKLGYGFAYRVLDAQYFGVPQQRRRVFIVGHLGTPWSASGQVLFEPEGVSRGFEKSGKSRKRDSRTFDKPVDSDSEPGARHYPTHTVSPCLQERGGKGPDSDMTQAYVVENADLIRRLTPLENERLQGFPDEWTSGMSDTTRYAMLGNAVAVPVATWLGRRIRKIQGELDASI